MRIREVQNWRRLLIQRSLLHVADDADDRPAPSITILRPTEIDVAPKWILVRENTPDELATYDDLLRCSGLCVAREQPSALQRNTDRAEEIRRHGDDLRRWLIVLGHRRPAAHPEAQCEVRAIEREPGRKSNLPNARDRPKPFVERRDEVALGGIARIGPLRQGEPECQHVLRAEPRIDAE